MYFTGFADEASKNLDGQIRATKELGWSYFESRNIDGKQMYDLTDKEFDILTEKLGAAGIGINCVGSAISNWSKSIDDPNSFDIMIGDVKRAIPRMQRLGTKLIRVMSYAVLERHDPNDQMQETRFEHLREMVNIFDGAGITAVHENCMNYGGMSWQHTLELVDNVPKLKLVFDTGNPVFLNDYSKAKPYPKQSSWEFYNNVKEFVKYLHIKDCKWDSTEQKAIYTFPGEGDGDVRKILSDLLQSGYDGGISIEPHMSVVFHDDSVSSDVNAMFSNYVKYGHKTMGLVHQIKKELDLKENG